MPKLVHKGIKEDRWSPNLVSPLESFLEQVIKPVPKLDSSRAKGIRKNVAYSLQYLEFLEQCDRDLHLTSVLATLNYKAFIITSCSVIEAIFFCVLLQNGRAAVTEWKSVQKVQSNEFRKGEACYKIENEIFKKLSEPELEEMSFNTMCKRVEGKKLIKLGQDVYNRIPYLRNLRNRVHIYGIENSTDTDYMRVNKSDFDQIKTTLKELLTCSLFPLQPPKHFPGLSFDFLNEQKVELATI